MVLHWYVVRQVQQSRHAVRNCAATQCVSTGITVQHIMLSLNSDRLQVKSAGMKHFALSALAAFSPVDN